MMKNPFLQKSIHPDWTAMTPESADADIRLALGNARANLDAIKAAKIISYDTIVHALDRATCELNQAWTYLNHLESVADTPQLREVLNSLMPVVSEFFSSIPLDDDLYAKVKEFSLTNQAKSLSGYKRKLLEETLLDFELNGAGLSPENKKELSDIEMQLSLKTQKFSENVLDDTKRFSLLVEDKSQLKGLPENAMSVAANKAAQKGLSGWEFTLEQPSYMPFMRYVENDLLREKMWRASARLASDGDYSNWDLIREILSLRQRKAELLGRANFADAVLCRRMAKTGQRAVNFVEDLHSKFFKHFESESEKLSDFAKSHGLLDANGLLPPWRVAFVAEKMRQAKYDFDTESLRPYFAMDSVMEGMFKICNTLYGLVIEKSKSDVNAWDASVDMFEVKDENSKVIGYFYTDFIPRKSKRAGAWMNLLSNGEGDKPALGVIAGNLSEPVDGHPALLSHDDVETLFHEFGHLIHFFLMDCPEFGLRNVAWDFVELPSQINENWCRDKSALDMFARHWQTGQKIPNELFEKFKKSRKFMGATAAMRQLAFAKIDLEMHLRADKFIAAESIESLARAYLADYTIRLSEPSPTILPRFTHLFGDSVGYAAGYYSYKWAEVLDADAFTRFEKDGLLNPKTGRDFAEKILRVGNTVEPEKAFENFMGRAPDVSALVSRTI